MERKRFDQQPCPIARAADLFGDWWVPLILREALYGVDQFNEFAERLDISKNILQQRLQRLVEAGIFERQLYCERPQRFRYRLTERGRSALQLLAAMAAWSNRWVFEEGQHPIELVDRRTGQVVEPVVTDARSGQPLQAEHLEMRPGPGFPSSPEIRAWRFGEGA